MVIFHSYVSLPEGTIWWCFCWFWHVMTGYKYMVIHRFIMFHLLGSVWRIVEQGIPMKASWWEIFQKAFKPCIYYSIYIYIIFPLISFIISVVIRDFPLRRSPSAAASAFTPCGWSCGMPSSAPRPPPMPCWSGKWRKLGGCANDGDWT